MARRAEALVFYRSSHVLGYWQVGQRLTDLLTHVQRMRVVVVEDKALGAMDVAFLGAVGILLEPDCIADSVEQLLGSFCDATLREPGFAPGAEL